MIEQTTQAAQTVDSVDGFRQWVRQNIRLVFPHGALACGHGRIHAAGVATDYILTVDFPVNHLSEICNPAGGLDTPLMRRWMDTRQPVLFDPCLHYTWPEVSPAWLERFNQNDLRNAAVHAVFDKERYLGTYFSFHRIERLPTAQETDALNALVPVMHETLMRVIQRLEKQEKEGRPSWEDLTQKEIEVATWIGRGKSNQDIAQRLNQSENTVKHHASRVMQKLGLSNRTQLAATIAHWPPGFVTKGTKVL